MYLNDCYLMLVNALIIKINPIKADWNKINIIVIKCWRTTRSHSVIIKSCYSNRNSKLGANTLWSSNLAQRLITKGKKKKI